MCEIVVLYTELMPYNIAVFRELLKRDCRISVVFGDTNKKTTYLPPVITGITYYPRSSFADQVQLYNFIEKLHPDLIWTAGWIDSLYNQVCGRIRRQLSIPVIAGSDTQWRGGKQWLNVLTSRFRHRQWFSHICIAGIMQYKYAHRLGFDDHRILTPNFSADIDLFLRAERNYTVFSYPKRLLYMGRFSPEKGLLPLLKVWQSLSDRNGWLLTLIGAGPLRDEMNGYPDVKILPYMSQEELLQFVSTSGGYILPSLFEPWALVLHEVAAAGLPILASDCCGAVPYFVKEGENGFLFTPGKGEEMRDVIDKFIHMDAVQLIGMGEKSRKLSVSITPSKVADAILSVLQKEDANG